MQHWVQGFKEEIFLVVKATSGRADQISFADTVLIPIPPRPKASSLVAPLLNMVMLQVTVPAFRLKQLEHELQEGARSFQLLLHPSSTCMPLQ